MDVKLGVPSADISWWTLKIRRCPSRKVDELSPALWTNYKFLPQPTGALHQWHSRTLSLWYYPTALCCIPKKKKWDMGVSDQAGTSGTMSLGVGGKDHGDILRIRVSQPWWLGRKVEQDISHRGVTMELRLIGFNLWNTSFTNIFRQMLMEDLCTQISEWREESCFESTTQTST